MEFFGLLIIIGIADACLAGDSEMVRFGLAAMVVIIAFSGRLI
jgi:hypothetical protein